MPKKPGVAIDTDNFQIRIDRLTLANARLAAKLAASNEELKLAKTSLLRIRADYEARVKNDYKVNIQEILGCPDNELLNLTRGKTIEQLEQMLQNFMLAADAHKTPYDKTKTKTVSIRPGVAGPIVPGSEDLTVGCLFGKSAKEIREMKGVF